MTSSFRVLGVRLSAIIAWSNMAVVVSGVFLWIQYDSELAFYTALTLTFPLGWICELFAPSGHSPPIFALLYIPMNAYLWGILGEEFIRTLHSRRLKALSKLKDAKQNEEGI